MRVFGFLSTRRGGERRPLAPELIDLAPLPDEPAAESPLDPNFEAELDAAFDSARFAVPSSAAAGRDQAEMRELFTQIAAQQSRPVKSFILELERGPAAREWVEICRPLVQGLGDAADQAGFDDIVEALGRVSDALTRAAAETGARIADDTRHSLLAAWGDAARRLPAAFQPSGTDRRRETIVLHALLREIPGVGHVTFERLYGAGFAALDVLLAASPEDLSVTTGIPRELTERICAVAREHREPLARLAPDELRARRGEELSQRLVGLQRLHAECERLRDVGGWEAAAVDARRSARAARDACSRRIDLLLAELDREDLVDQLGCLPLTQRIEALGEFLSATSGAQPERR